MEAGSIYILWLRDMKQLLRSKMRILASVTTPILWLGIIGIGLDSAIGRMPVAGADYLSFMAPGILAMTMLFTGTFSGVSVLWDKQFGFMKEILVSPVSRLKIMAGKVIGGATTAIMQGALILIIARLMGVPLPGITGLLTILVFMILISFSFVSIGLAFASQMEDPQTFPRVINFFIMPMFFLSGAIYPIETAPGWLGTISKIVPLTYGVDGLRGVILGTYQFSLWIDLGVLTVFMISVVLIGAYLFKEMKV